MKTRLLILLLLITPATSWAWMGIHVAGGGVPAEGLTCTYGSGDSDIVSHTGHSSSSTSVSATHYRGGRIILSAETRVTAIKLWITNGLGSAYDGYVEIRTTSGDPALPTSTVVASDTTEIPTGSAELVFELSSPVTLSARTYAVVLHGENADDNLGIGLGYDSEAGSFYWTNDGSTWGEDTGANIYLIVTGCQ